MNTVQIIARSIAYNRGRTLDLLDRVEQTADPQKTLLWRPAPGRAHIGWQLVHVAVCEEMFAIAVSDTPISPQFQAYWPDFQNGSTPPDSVPTIEQIREILASTRQMFLQAYEDQGDERLDEIPADFKSFNWSKLDLLHLTSWHESHHQGQAHLTLNLFNAAQK